MARWRSGSGTPAGIDLCLTALHQRGISGSVAVVGAFRMKYPDYELSDSMVKSMLNGTREPKPDFVHRLARLADVPVAQVFAHLGWLPPRRRPIPACSIWCGSCARASRRPGSWPGRRRSRGSTAPRWPPRRRC